MPRNITAILIDPFEGSVKRVEYDASDYRNMYPLLSAPQHPVDTFTTAPFFGDGDGEGETLYVDDEGLFKTPTAFFQIDGAGQPYAGRGLIVGSDENGDSISTRLTVEAVAARVRYGVFA